MFDAVNVAKRALHSVGQTKPVSTAELSCNSGQQPWDLGLSYFNALKSVSEKVCENGRKWGLILQLVWPLRRTPLWTQVAQNDILNTAHDCWDAVLTPVISSYTGGLHAETLHPTRFTIKGQFH